MSLAKNLKSSIFRAVLVSKLSMLDSGSYSAIGLTCFLIWSLCSLWSRLLRPSYSSMVSSIIPSSSLRSSLFLRYVPRSYLDWMMCSYYCYWWCCCKWWFLISAEESGLSADATITPVRLGFPARLKIPPTRACPSLSEFSLWPPYLKSSKPVAAPFSCYKTLLRRIVAALLPFYAYWDPATTPMKSLITGLLPAETPAGVAIPVLLLYVEDGGTPGWWWDEVPGAIAVVAGWLVWLVPRATELFLEPLVPTSWWDGCY